MSQASDSVLPDSDTGVAAAGEDGEAAGLVGGETKGVARARSLSAALSFSARCTRCAGCLRANSRTRRVFFSLTHTPHPSHTHPSVAMEVTGGGGGPGDAPAQDVGGAEGGDEGSPPSSSSPADSASDGADPPSSPLPARSPSPPPPTQDEMAAVRAANIAALVGGDLAVTRRPLMRSLSVAGAEAVLRRAFVCPHPAAPAGGSHALARKLAKRSYFVPWGATAPLRRPVLAGSGGMDGGIAGPGSGPPSAADLDDGGPPPGEPLILWQRPPPPPPPARRPVLGPDGEPASESPASSPASPGGPASIAVDAMLVRWLRPHQREGVQFMWECVTGQRPGTGPAGRGVLLADDMGLGKVRLRFWREGG
jgi:hypothetical protein